jgi:hypothetical protein
MPAVTPASDFKNTLRLVITLFDFDFQFSYETNMLAKSFVPMAQKALKA